MYQNIVRDKSDVIWMVRSVGGMSRTHLSKNVSDQLNPTETFVRFLGITFFAHKER